MADDAKQGSTPANQPAAQAASNQPAQAAPLRPIVRRSATNPAVPDAREAKVESVHFSRDGEKE